ncbi:PIN domain-containing protein [Choanephora cucurbitarum]|nr:PIN domain-containing protein [Choanephora cucurbitarum]
MSLDDLEFMDVDGPEFINDVNHQIASIRADHNYEYLDIPMIVPDQLNLQPHAFAEIAVLDTNFLLSKLGYLDVLLTLAEENPGNLLVILPWVVIRELDGLKESGHHSDVRASARKAMRFLELRLRDKSISLRGQKMNEVANQAIIHTKEAKGDDRILDCCMYFQQLTQQRVILLSNDRNLCIKVMVHEIESVSAESVDKMEALLNRAGGKRGTTLDSKYSHTIRRNHRQQQHHHQAEHYNQAVEDYVSL